MSLYKANCSVCQVAKGSPHFRARLRVAAFKRERGDETLADIAKEYSLNLGPIYNHVKKHITDNSDEMAARRQVMVAKKTEIVRATVQKEMELSLEPAVFDALDSRPAEIQALDDYIAQAYDKIKKGELQVTSTNFLSATKIRSDWASKQQGNKIEFLKTMNAFRSGAKKPTKQTEEKTDGDVTGTTGDNGEGSDGYSAVRGQTPRYVSPRRTDNVPQPDQSPEQED